MELLLCVDGDKIRSATGGSRHQAQHNGGTVDHSTEDTNQKNVLGNHIAWDQVRKHCHGTNGNAGKNRKLLTNLPIT